TRKLKESKKIEIKIIENADERLITFSKRRTGIYKKISELSTLCGGHPPDESVAKRFSNASQHLEETTDAPVETYRKERINLLVQDFNDVQDQLDVIKVKQKEIALAKRSNGTKIRYWWKAPIDQLNLRELYEQDERFAEFNNLITITRDKKNAAISSMKALMDEDFPSAFPPKYGLNQQ
ncbi:hypothetical protein ERO13_D06G115728v2, partial [Gossypium hirsutum]